MTGELIAEPDYSKAQQAAHDAVTPDVFDFASVVSNRSYPETVVGIYLDERSVQEMLTIEKTRDKLETRLTLPSEQTVERAEELVSLDAQYEAVVEKLRSQRYDVTIKGIAPEESIKLEDLSYESFPKEFVETTNPITGMVIKKEVPNEDRDYLFTNLLRQAHLVQVEAPNGAIDRNFSDIEKVAKMWAEMPLVARAKLDGAINESTIAVDYYLQLVDEVF